MFELILTPKEASIALYFANTVGWLGLLLFDFFTKGYRLKKTNTVTLIAYALVSTLGAHIFFILTPGSTHVGFIWALCVIHLFYPLRFFYKSISYWFYSEMCVASMYGVGLSMLWLYVNNHSFIFAIVGYGVWMLFLFLTITPAYNKRLLAFIYK